MFSVLSRLVGAALIGATVMTSGALAASEPSDPKKQTPWGLYVTSKEAYEMKTADPDGVLFVDVREPIEMMFTGYTDVVDANVPFLQVNPSKWNEKKPGKFAMEKNPKFADGVMAALSAKGLDANAPILLMCRSGGTRGAPSAKALDGLGLKKVYVVVDGFEGSTDKDNPNGPWRTVNGWKNAGLPWGYKLNPEKVYVRPAGF